MNAVEIEQAISDLALKEFDRHEFPYAFLQAFGNNETTLKRLRSGSSNKSDLGGVLQANNIHILVCDQGDVTHNLAKLKESPATTKSKARFILATDGVEFAAEDTDTDEPIACAYKDFPDHFGFFLPLAGISTVKQVRESSFDIRATSRLNKLYVELLKDNPEWGSTERRPDMNHFMARLIFCFFAEDTEIFYKKGLFSESVAQMSERDSSNTHEVISEIFRSMNTKRELRSAEGIPRWADVFPYVNGGLFSGTTETPKFSKIARTYLLHTGSLDWTKINPDIFGSMIQAVTDEEERASLGMHYTSVPNILKVLNPLFLDDLRAKLEEAGDNPRTLLNLRKRISRIRVFDPACGSGNFLVIAYKQMREIENTINERRGEEGRKSDIPLTNFRGIELRDFPAEVARLALIIAEYQSDLLYRGQKEALQDFLPLSTENWITCGNALKLDWLSVCPSTGTSSGIVADDLFEEHAADPVIDFANEGGETYLCGNPPYIWSNEQNKSQKSELLDLQKPYGANSKILDYVTGWVFKFLNYQRHCDAKAAFVTTNSITQGSQVDALWKIVFSENIQIVFAHTAFKWFNLAKSNAGVTCVIIGLGKSANVDRYLYDGERCRVVRNISPYLLPMDDIWIVKSSNPMNGLLPMYKGSQPTCGGGLLMSSEEKISLPPSAQKYIKKLVGSDEISNGLIRHCIWVEAEQYKDAAKIPELQSRFEIVQDARLKSTKEATQKFSDRPYRFTEIRREKGRFIAVPCVSSEDRPYLTPCVFKDDTIITNRCFGVYTSDLSYFSILSSRLHWLWVECSSGKLETRLNYSNTLSWNTFSIPDLTEKNRADLTKCAEDILLARERHFPSTIADLYDPKDMPDDLREAHQSNDEVLERIYIGRRFRNDTERLEKLFDLYTEMVASKGISKSKAKL